MAEDDLGVSKKETPSNKSWTLWQTEGCEDTIKELQARVSALRVELEEEQAQLESERASFDSQLSREREQFTSEKTKYKKLWSMYCSQSARDDELLAVKGREIEKLHKRLAEHERGDRRATVHATGRALRYSVERTSVDARECTPMGSRAAEHTSIDMPRSVPMDTPYSVLMATHRAARLDTPPRVIPHAIPGDMHHAVPGDASPTTTHPAVPSDTPPRNSHLIATPPGTSIVDTERSSPTKGSCLFPPIDAHPRRGKAPHIDTFGGETSFEDWLPALERAALWNSWSDEETLLQLAGHLRDYPEFRRDYSDTWRCHLEFQSHYSETWRHYPEFRRDYSDIWRCHSESR